jgi:hypothetical protein
MGEKQGRATAAAAQAQVELPLCACGCGQRVAKASSRFIASHSVRGRNNVGQHIEAIRLQHCRTACGFCEWTFDGPVQAGHAAFVSHLTARHPLERAALDNPERQSAKRRFRKPTYLR